MTTRWLPAQDGQGPWRPSPLGPRRPKPPVPPLGPQQVSKRLNLIAPLGPSRCFILVGFSKLVKTPVLCPSSPGEWGCLWDMVLLGELGDSSPGSDPWAHGVLGISGKRVQAPRSPWALAVCDRQDPGSELPAHTPTLTSLLTTPCAQRPGDPLWGIHTRRDIPGGRGP